MKEIVIVALLSVDTILSVLAVQQVMRNIDAPAIHDMNEDFIPRHSH